MIATVHGKLTWKSPTSVIIETGGIGLQIFIPVSSLEAIGDIGENVQLFTHLHVREDALQLFGFATKAERELFLFLISVSGVGPKLAQSVLSGISVDDFRRAIQQQDIAALSRVPGIGKKTAERLIVELKEKIGRSDAALAASSKISSSEEAVMALLSLGYRRAQAEPIVQSLLKQDVSMPIEELIRRALREM